MNHNCMLPRPQQVKARLQTWAGSCLPQPSLQHVHSNAIHDEQISLLSDAVRAPYLKERLKVQVLLVHDLAAGHDHEGRQQWMGCHRSIQGRKGFFKHRNSCWATLPQLWNVVKVACMGHTLLYGRSSMALGHQQSRGSCALPASL